MNSFAANSIKPGHGFDFPANILALGGELKSSVCQLHHGKAWISEVIGDLEQEHIYRHFRKQVNHALVSGHPSLLVVDKHPDYLSTQWGQQLADQHSIALVAVQHHHAHIAAVMADNQLPISSGPILGLALDGAGFGDDNTIWGGEVLLADYQKFERLACFQPAAMIGGAASVHEPWRNTLAQLLPIWPDVAEQFADTDIVQFLHTKPLALLRTMTNRQLNSPLASSCGRLFDAVAAALDLHREQVTYEAEAAIALEKLAATCFDHDTRSYNYRIDSGPCLQLNWQPMWLELLADLQNGTPPATIAAAFHHTLIHALNAVTLRLRDIHTFDTVALSGGVFQNHLLATRLPAVLQANGLNVLQHQQVPAHDGGLSLGQAVIAAAQLQGGRKAYD